MHRLKQSELGGEESEQWVHLSLPAWEDEWGAMDGVGREKIDEGGSLWSKTLREYFRSGFEDNEVHFDRCCARVYRERRGG